MSDKNRNISLVLGSGGARGHAHIGVIRALEERGFAIRNIAGSSVGALIGGIYATGQLETYSSWAHELERSDVVKLLDFAFSWKSIFKGERIFEVLKDLIGDCQIEDLDRGFTAVATALDEQREVWLNAGPLFAAVRASSAVPGVFAPVRYQGRMLVDGGLVNPIPIAPTLNDATDLTIAVNLNGMNTACERPQKPVKRSLGHSDSIYRSKIAGFIRDLVHSDDEQADLPDAADVLTRSFDVMQGGIARLKLAAYAPDIVIEIPRQACSFFEFHRAGEMAELGYEATCKAMTGFE